MSNWPHQFSMSLVVGQDAIDELDHVNNAVYLQYAEQIARRHAESAGLSTDAMIEAGGMFVARRHEITYYHPAHLGDELELLTRISSASGARAIRDVQILRDGLRVAQVETEWVWIDAVARTPKRMPPQVSSALPPLKQEG